MTNTIVNQFSVRQVHCVHCTMETMLQKQVEKMCTRISGMDHQVSLRLTTKIQQTTVSEPTSCTSRRMYLSVSCFVAFQMLSTYTDREGRVHTNKRSDGSAQCVWGCTKRSVHTVTEVPKVTRCQTPLVKGESTRRTDAKNTLDT